MSGSIALTTIVGAIGYLWLTAVTHPLVKGLHATRQDKWTDRWAAALPLTIAMAVVSAAVPAAVFVLLAMAAPSIDTYLPDLDGAPLGLIVAAALWVLRAIIFGIPRLPEDFEMALALGVVALRTDDPEVLSSVARRYERYILGTPVERVYGAERVSVV